MHQLTLKGRYIQNMTDEDLVKFCRDNEHLKIAREPDGSLVLGPVHTMRSGSIVSEVAYQLVKWEKQNKSWGECLLSVGFILPDGSMRSPNIAAISNEKVKEIRKQDKDSFPRLCPDFLVEVKSEWDLIQDKQTKMHEWIANGSQLSWLIDSDEEKVYIYRKDGSVDKVDNFEQTLSGEAVLPGLELDLRELRID